MRFQLVTFVITLLLLTVGCGYKSNFTDKALEERFRRSEVDFNILVKMFKEDSELSKVTHESAYVSYNVKANLSQQRLDEYHQLLRKLNLINVWRGEKTGNIYLTIWSKSDFPAGGSDECYVYAEHSQIESKYLVDSLDVLRKNTDCFAYKKITEGWYLHVDNW